MKPTELKNIAPKLSELKSIDSGFKVPNQYFESVESAIILKTTTNNSTGKSPFKIPENYFDTVEDKVLNFIASDKLKSNYSVPENYFDTVEDRVFEKIKSEPKIINFKSRFTKTFLPIAVAASILFFITLQLFNENNSNDLLASLKTSEIETWIDNGELELNSFELAEVYDDVEFEDLEINQLYNDESLIEYLDDIDIESLDLTN